MNNLAFQIYGSTKSGIFQSTWKTDNAGVSSSTQIELPLLSGGTYNFWIDWGDGSTTNVTSYSQRTHTYASAGTYTLRATGTINGWGFQNSGDKLKILTISSWGKLKNLTQGFYGCSNLTLSGITDILDLTGTTSLGAMFSGCSKITTVGRMNEWDTSLITSMSNMFVACVLFNQPLNNWNTGNVTGFVNMFSSCYLFNQCLGSWNITKCTSFEGMFSGCINFNNGDNSVPLNNWVLNTTAASVSLNYTFLSCSSFNRYLGGWDTSKVNIMSSLFSGCPSFNNGFASGVTNQLPWNTSACTNMSGMFQGASAFNSNLGTGTTPWDMSKVTDFLNMFRSASKFNNGDDTAPINNWNINTISSISMSAMFFSASVFNRNISSWNVSKVNNFGGMFQNANSFNNGYASGISNQLPWIINTTSSVDMSNLFASALAFNSNLGTGTTPWDVSKVTSFGAMFNGATNFNNGDDAAPINNWSINTVSNVSMASMFQSASNFNRDVSNWNMTKVVNTSSMFYFARDFNQPLANWERIGSTLANVTNMQSMFQNIFVFNQPIGNWNVSGVTNMYQMFNFTTAFNQDISSWNVGKVTTFQNIFGGATAFNNGSNSNTNPVTSRTGIDGWDINTVSNVTMDGMFQSANAFNRPIDNWYMTKVTNINSMFRSSTFNHPLSNWERIGSTLGNVTDMGDMFASNIVFNQDIGNWNTSSVTTMLEMFFQATAFNQNIGSWNVSNVINFVNFMYLKTNLNFSSTNLDAIYNGWSALPSLKPNLSISFGTAKYSQTGKPGKDTLLASPNNWTITDGLLTVSGTSNNGGLIRVITTAAHGFTTGNSVYIYGVNGTTNANGTWTVTVVSSTIIELQGSTYNAAWTSGGNVILG